MPKHGSKPQKTHAEKMTKKKAKRAAKVLKGKK